MNSMSMAPTAERVKKSADIDLPIVDTKRRRNAFRLIGPVEKMWRDGRIRDEQLAGFRKFERDIAITSPSKTLLARIGGLPGGCIENGTEDALDVRSEAFRSLAEIERWMEPQTLEAMKSMVLNDTSLESIGREVLMITNRPQAKAAAERTLQQGTWTLAVFYGCIAQSDAASTRPG